MWISWMVLARAEPGSVTVPLEVWEQRTAPRAQQGEPAAVPIRRSLTGKVERGRLVGELALEVAVLGGAVDIPVIGHDVTLVDALLDGRTVVPRLGEPFATVRAGPGEHLVQVRFVQGTPNERFGRSLELSLPPGGPTALDLLVPEQPVEATLSTGVIVESTSDGQRTQLRGWVDAQGKVALTWQRKAEHAEQQDEADLVARLDALVEVGEDVATGIARVDYDVRSGSVDQLRLDVPPGVEVLDATGPSVLQWYTSRTETGSTLEVLLREVASDQAQATVRFQYPVERGADLPLMLPWPAGHVPTAGVVGTLAPAGFEVATTRVEQAKELDPRDVPRSVLDLSADPVRQAFSFEQTPQIALRVERQPELSVSTTRIDDLQGLTVLVDDGGEVGKLRLTVRNTTRQVLTVDLPEGARLTHCFRDGLPLRPATEEGRPERVLVPLTRSEQQGPATHVVQPGETLSGIALRYRGSGGAWRSIADANPVINPDALTVGTVLTVPASTDGAAERSFVLELAWERRAPPVGSLGWRELAVPTLDLEVMSADWHVYLPARLEVVWTRTPLVLEGRRDPLARLVDGIVSAALPATDAYAGGDSWEDEVGYQNILSNRKAVYEKKQKDTVEQRTDPFPLVGRKYALHGSLLGTGPLSLGVAFLDRSLVSVLHWMVLALAAATVIAAALRPRASTFAALGAVLAGGMLLGSGLLGTWAQLAWGVDLGLLVVLARFGAALPLPLPQLAGSAVVVAGSMLIMALCSGSPLMVLLPLLAGLCWTVAVRRTR
jgi:nucleoid-associated protein YgaU